MMVEVVVKEVVVAGPFKEGSPATLFWGFALKGAPSFQVPV
jgi:hypothetical protein